MISQATTGLPTDAAHIDTIAVSPDPPRPGQNMTVTVTGTVKETIEVRFSNYVIGDQVADVVAGRL